MDAFLEIAGEAEAERTPPEPTATAEVADTLHESRIEPTTHREKYPSTPTIFTPDGPTLFDERDPTEVLSGAIAVPYAHNSAALAGKLP